MCYEYSLWCERRDLNPYELPHTPLKRARLPIPPLSHIKFLQPRKACVRVTLAVPKIRCLLSASPNFDRYAISYSLFRPPDAVILNAADSATPAYSLHSLECLYNISLLLSLVKTFFEVFLQSFK